MFVNEGIQKFLPQGSGDLGIDSKGQPWALDHCTTLGVGEAREAIIGIKTSPVPVGLQYFQCRLSDLHSPLQRLV